MNKYAKLAYESLRTFYNINGVIVLESWEKLPKVGRQGWTHAIKSAIEQFQADSLPK